MNEGENLHVAFTNSVDQTIAGYQKLTDSGIIFFFNHSSTICELSKRASRIASFAN
jgi:hypothetical protein